MLACHQSVKGGPKTVSCSCQRRPSAHDGTDVKAKNGDSFHKADPEDLIQALLDRPPLSNHGGTQHVSCRRQEEASAHS